MTINPTFFAMPTRTSLPICGTNHVSVPERAGLVEGGNKHRAVGLRRCSETGTQEVAREAKEMANKIKEPADMRDLERHLTQRRKDIDRRYEFRSSRLTQVFGILLCEASNR